MSDTYAPFAKPVYLMAKPVGSRCNLLCAYCYYLGKSAPDAQGTPSVMSDELLEKFIREYIGMQTVPYVLFNWHGGEALLRPLAFYERVLELQAKYGRGRQIDNAIQTNGTLLTPDWCRFFKRHHWLVGLSIDGPREFHDRYRRAVNGAPSFDRVMKGISLLEQYGVEWNALATINSYNADHPLEFYRFFKEIECRYIQFTPIVERLAPQRGNYRRLLAPEEETGEIAPYSVSPEQWGEFLCALFDEWVRRDVGDYYIQLFDATLANWMQVTPGICSMARTCGHAGVIEANGDVYSCDHFVFPSYKLGNIHSQSLISMMYSERQMRFGAAKRDLLPAQCNACEYLPLCNGECPKNRISRTQDGEKGLNYLCAGYKRFFEHTAPYMRYMSRCLQRQQPPALVMEWVRQGMPPYE